MMTVVLAFIGGIMMSRTMMHRIEIINGACLRIMEGDLTQRIPAQAAMMI